MRSRYLLVLGLLATVATALVVGLGTAGAHPPVTGVVPSSFSATGAPGATFTVNKVVHTPEIAPKPDIYFLADTTGSMGSVIGSVQASAASLLSTLAAATTDERFGGGDYKDFPNDSYAFNNAAPIPAADDGGAAAAAAIAGWSAGGGNDGPEGQFYALHQLSEHSAATWRSGSTKIVVWFGDAPAHDPVCTAISGDAHAITQASLIADLVAAGIRVVAISTLTGYPAGLDNFPSGGGDYIAACGSEGGAAGQATAIAAATGGVHLIGVSAGDIAAAILAGLGNLPVTVTTAVTCDPGLSISLSPSGPQTVTSGDDVAYTETISVSPSAAPGTYSCTVDFLLDGKKVDGFTQTVSIVVVDRTPPTAGCVETNNPSGGNVPTSGPNAGKSGQNPDGFYVLTASDNFDPNPQIFVGDTGSSYVFGPFTSGTKIKLTQAPGVTPNQKPGTGDINWKIQLKGDALVSAVDSAGNTSAFVSCKVPPPPK